MADTESQESLDQAFDEQARITELALARVRLVALAVGGSIDAVRFALGLDRGPDALSVPLITAVWFFFALAVQQRMQRVLIAYWQRVLLLVSDPLFLVGIMLNAIRVHGVDDFIAQGRYAASAAACALVAASGGVRVGDRASRFTLWLAMLAWMAVAFATRSRIPFISNGYPLLFIFGAGMLSFRMRELTRSAVQSELARMTIRRFLPNRVVDGAFSDPEELFGPPRTVEATVLVSDLRGFTALSEGLAPDVVLTFLNDLQGRFAACVGRHGGTVDKFMGDGMLAVFGAPEALPDHADQALACVRAMRAEVAGLNEARRKLDLADIRIGVGLHAGPVVVGCLGSGARLEFTVIGDTVNTASRLEAMTKNLGTDVLVSAGVVERSRSPELLPFLSEVEVRGRVQGLRVHRLE